MLGTIRNFTGFIIYCATRYQLNGKLVFGWMNTSLNIKKKKTRRTVHPYIRNEVQRVRNKTSVWIIMPVIQASHDKTVKVILNSSKRSSGSINEPFFDLRAPSLKTSSQSIDCVLWKGSSVKHPPTFILATWILTRMFSLLMEQIYGLLRIILTL